MTQTAARRGLYPEIEPYATYRVPVGDGHELYVEEVGNPAGTPAVFLHGGPGGGIVPSARRFFDPDRYRVLLFDQRGCGRSTPAGSLHANTTGHLVADIETLRTRAGVERWLVFGGSWGSTLGLAYAQAFPDRVTALVLRGIWLLRRSEEAWFYQHGADRLQPEEWQRFVSVVPAGERADVPGAYARRLLGDDRTEALRWANAWLRWEVVNGALVPDLSVLDTIDEESGLAFARILTHYVRGRGFLSSEDQLLDGVELIRHLPAVIVQGRYDLCCPPVTAWELAQRWPEAELRIVPDAGHSATEPGTVDELIRATDRFA